MPAKITSRGPILETLLKNFPIIYIPFYVRGPFIKGKSHKTYRIMRLPFPEQHLEHQPYAWHLYQTMQMSSEYRLNGQARGQSYR